MKKAIFLFIILFANLAKAQTISSISPDQLLQLSKVQKLQLLDVRTTDEFDAGYIKGAININVQAKDFEKQIQYLDTSKPIYVYCLSGGRSAAACDILIKHNFKNIFNMTGGIMQWRQDKKPLVVKQMPAQASMTLADYKKLVSGTKPVLVEFFAPWCAPCKILKPKVQEIANSYANTLEVIFIDVDIHKQLADDLHIGSIPEMRFYKKGKQKFKLIGDQSKATLLKKMKL
jgi:thioredoxin 1